MSRFSLALTLVLLTGCCVKQAAVDTGQATAAGNDRYTQLVTLSLTGQSNLMRDGIAPVSTNDLKSTPRSVRGLVTRLLQALHTNRVSSHSILFQLNEGPDPDTMGLEPVKLPTFKDENDGLLEGN